MSNAHYDDIIDIHTESIIHSSNHLDSCLKNEDRKKWIERIQRSIMLIENCMESQNKE